VHPTGQTASRPLDARGLAFLRGCRRRVLDPAARSGGIRWSHQVRSTDGHHSRPTRGHNRPEAASRDRQELASGRFVDRRCCVTKIDDRARTSVRKIFGTTAARRYPHLVRLSSATIAYTESWSLCGSIELRRSALVSERHTRVPASEEACNRRARHEPAIGAWRHDLGARIGP
jgi:hypothetical protein